MESGGEKVIISGLQSETRYAVRVRCDCGVDGGSKESVTVNVSTKKITSRLADDLKQTSEEMNSDTPSVWKLPLKEERTTIHGCRRYSFGEESNRGNRTVILFGQSGSGKSTLINAMVNYILGVKWEDSYRFKLVEAESQTSEATVYKINHREGFQIPHSLTIIDTPGFGDTRGIERDKEITQQLQRLFTQKSGVSEIDIVCFVTHSALARLTPTQKHVFDSVLSIFGKDVAENIRILVTFADGQRPPVLEAINASGFPCPKTDDGLPPHFKFNNSALKRQSELGKIQFITEVCFSLNRLQMDKVLDLKVVQRQVSC
uniref:AAA+ ATPase domain-containing protein n=1 Tax=Sphaeramia orbicularis TaxID=375764 RepID=A0A672Z1I1_9TELE